ncbi:methyltransferase domain-containing protein [Candidatus Jidaibacter acanthamoebae]|nr:methyltransferase domain-containing protein [Candidatus Jidaibacter acanthamoeba]
MPHTNQKITANEVSALMCPVCGGEKLIGFEKYLGCAKGHIYDKARQGYVNLLSANQKNSKNPGDNRMMVKSRAKFLNEGYYQPISNTLNMLITNEYLKPVKDNFHIADIGCGEGYYLSNLKQHLDSHLKVKANYYGIDISKEAIKLAAGHNKGILWCVGSAIKLPLQEKTIDIALSVFAPLYLNEYHRVLADMGRLITVTPSTLHLIEMRNILFSSITEKEKDKLVKKAEEYFTLENCLPLTFKCRIGVQEDIESLLAMTPFYFKSGGEKKAELLSLKELTVTVDVKISVFKKRGE